MRCLILLISFMFSSSLMADDVTISLERSWGLLIGDDVVTHVVLPVNVSDIDEDSLPQLDKRYGPWLQLQQMTSTGQQLELHYQLINVPAETRELNTPTYTLRTRAGEELTVPAARFSAGSFLEKIEGAPTDRVLREDHQLATADLSRLQKQLLWAGAVALFSGLIWFVWHIGLRPGKRLPFARAVFSMNKLRWFGHKDIDAATRVMHRAFNESAATVITHSQLSQLWDACPWLVDLQPEIATFYQQSASHYFSQHPQQKMTFDSLLSLSRACRAREKMA